MEHARGRPASVGFSQPSGASDGDPFELSPVPEAVLASLGHGIETWFRRAICQLIRRRRLDYLSTTTEALWNEHLCETGNNRNDRQRRTSSRRYLLGGT